VPPLNLPVSVWGRPIKPLALGMAVAMIVLTLAGLLDRGALGRSLWGDFVALVAFSSFMAFLGGWWGQSQRMAEVALLLACGVFTTRAAALLMLHFEVLDIAAWLSVASAITAGGAYVLERVDPRGQPRAVRDAP
jgi:hypothetical protein